jgi:hypothetical protein
MIRIDLAISMRISVLVEMMKMMKPRPTDTASLGMVILVSVTNTSTETGKEAATQTGGGGRKAMMTTCVTIGQRTWSTTGHIETMIGSKVLNRYRFFNKEPVFRTSVALGP